ncbi:MAG: hypothetical protein HYS81_01215 [Candidatus Aenigmatarchaeota archaeon]|nr:MAG: hypothetical protein HYS81_01215 [Candidatus Aenigmarchaeota archaeon]
MIGALLLQIPVGVGSEIRQFTQSEFFVFVIPFLLSFAIVYGFLGHAKVPKDPQIRAVISLLVGLLTLPAAPILVGFLTPLSGSLLVLIGGLLVLIIMLEMLGLGSKGKSYIEKTKEGVSLKSLPGSGLFQRHGTGFAIIMIAAALLIFFNAGGLNLLGFQTPGVFLNAPLIFFLIVIFLVVYFVSLKE